LLFLFGFPFSFQPFSFFSLFHSVSFLVLGFTALSFSFMFC
jgi:hypothetical protein